MVRISLLGITGAGKTTQAENIEDEYGIPAMTVGDFFRDNRGFPLGPDRELVRGPRGAVYEDARDLGDGLYDMTVGQVYDEGGWLPWETLMHIIEPELQQDGGLVVDGLHRVPPPGYDELSFNAVIYLDVDADTAWERVRQRGRRDDTEEVFADKVSRQVSGAERVLDFYRERPGTEVYVVDGDSGRGDDEIFSEEIDPVVERYVQEVEA